MESIAAQDEIWFVGATVAGATKQQNNIKSR